MKRAAPAMFASLLTISAASAQWGVNGTKLFYTNGNVGVGTNDPAFPFQVRAGAFTRALSAENTAVSGVTNGLWGQSASISGRGVFGWATAGSGVNYGVLGQSNSTSGRGVFGWANKPTGTTFGVVGRSDSTNGRGAFGWAAAGTGFTLGVLGQSDSTTGRGVYGVATAAGGNNYGVRGESASPTGVGVFGGAATGVRGQSAGTNGRGVHGLATAPSGVTSGVYGQSASPDGFGVFGLASAANGGGRGVSGESQGESGIGVYGIANGPFNTTYGVFGFSTFGFGVFTPNNMGAGGTKPFRIDHPEDPTNKYLLHYSAESPEVINFYRGTAALDGAGGAVVQLPAYFARINKDPSYLLTAIGAPMPLLHVAEELDAGALSAGAAAGPGEPAPTCSFRIAGGAPGGKVSWRVEAVRNDLWVRTRGASVEVEKTGSERGTYQQPDLYGMPPEMGMSYRPAEPGA